MAGWREGTRRGGEKGHGAFKSVAEGGSVKESVAEGGSVKESVAEGGSVKESVAWENALDWNRAGGRETTACSRVRPTATYREAERADVGRRRRIRT